MESFRRYIDYHKLYYLKSKTAFFNTLEKSEDTNVNEKNKQAFNLVFETLSTQLKQEDKTIEKMQMRDYYSAPNKIVQPLVIMGIDF
jgi:GTPase SAR1 family protein